MMVLSWRTTQKGGTAKGRGKREGGFEQCKVPQVEITDVDMDWYAERRDKKRELIRRQLDV